MALAQSEIYTANGTEGTSKTYSVLVGKTILLSFLGDKILAPVASSPTPEQYVFDDSTGEITYGTDLQDTQTTQIIYR
jgi:hypothetical protein